MRTLKRGLTLSLFLLVAAASLAVCGCGSAAGDTGERGVATKAKDAFAAGDMADLIDMMTPEAQKTLEVRRDALVQTVKDKDADGREKAFNDINKRMWWKKDWKAIKDADEIGKLDITLVFPDTTERASYPVRVKSFKEHVDDLRIVEYSRSHDPSNVEWGSASVTFANRWNESLTVSLTQRAGVWYVTDVSPEGFKLRDEKKMKEDGDLKTE